VHLAQSEGGRTLDARCLTLASPSAEPSSRSHSSDTSNRSAVNVIAPVGLAHDIVAQMAAEGRGEVLFVSSLSATTPTPFETMYGPRRSFLTAFVHGLREEHCDSGVSVAILHPATDFHSRAGMADTRFETTAGEPTGTRRPTGPTNAMRRGTASVIGRDSKTKRAGLIRRLPTGERRADDKHASAATVRVASEALFACRLTFCPFQNSRPASRQPSAVHELVLDVVVRYFVTAAPCA
jgi:NAD(P)-dependent dehydrogenase (short-subunit alcohol dehydrogenase family)